MAEASMKLFDLEEGMTDGEEGRLAEGRLAEGPAIQKMLGVGCMCRG